MAAPFWPAPNARARRSRAVKRVRSHRVYPGQQSGLWLRPRFSPGGGSQRTRVFLVGVKTVEEAGKTPKAYQELFPVTVNLKGTLPNSFLF